MRRVLSILLVLVVLLVLMAGAAWWYLFGTNAVASAELVPTDTVAFATIPNAMAIATGYQSSQLKTLVDSPNTKPLTDWIQQELGAKNLDLINAFLPNLSGQSFVAVTHFDADHPEKIGLIAAMKPKAGLGNFDAFVEKLKAAYPDVLKQGKTGTGNVVGVDYQWIQGPGSKDKICVAQVSGWIVTTWGEASLQDWIERFHKKSSTPSLAENPDYQKSLERVGKNSMALTYVNYHSILDALQKQMTKKNPAAGDYLAKKLGALGGLAIGTRFENGEIVDRFSFLIPRQAQIDAGMPSAACPFDTLKFTGHDTFLYWASSVNWQQYWKTIQTQPQALAQSPMPNPVELANSLQTLAQDAGLDFQKNIIDPLGQEFSVQAEWSADTLYPEVGIFVKLDKPDDFKPTINALINAVRAKYANAAVINEIKTPDHTFASLKFVTQPLPITPTITEDGPYLGIFLSENQAVRSFQREEAMNLTHNADFTRQIGDKRNGASQILFLDSPRLVDRAYRTVLPYLSMAAMFNQTLAGVLKGHDLPQDLTWLAPMGTWSFVVSPDDDGIKGYSASGVGNQGIFLAGGIGGGVSALQMMGMIPKTTHSYHPLSGTPAQTAPASASPQTPPPLNNPAGSTNDTMAPAAPTPPPATPDSATNSVSAPTPEAAPAATTNSNSDANPPPPDQTKMQ